MLISLDKPWLNAHRPHLSRQVHGAGSWRENRNGAFRLGGVEDKRKVPVELTAAAVRTGKACRSIAKGAAWNILNMRFVYSTGGPGQFIILREKPNHFVPWAHLIAIHVMCYPFTGDVYFFQHTMACTCPHPPLQVQTTHQSTEVDG